jgi:hypothetical protein
LDQNDSESTDDGMIDEYGAQSTDDSSSDSEADCEMSDESDESLEDEAWNARDASEIGLSVWRDEVYARGAH